ncbi:hypothetical protein CJ030_MR5G024651 [Morella rubra]|uniref:WAT1-related protein n=1 Tax=Morella rubra TaxID=262757 RepID=A0A6A1VGU4_9ROSI|nr:hypothetical protein CJ030_MR6G024178 [Morella rubra]KAB1212079.1 hypothetical protein CJ030_MR5G024651 [Morella rubra]
MDDKKPYLAVILIQAIYTAMFLLSKAAFNGGMNNFVFVFYRQAVATIFLAPLAVFFEWRKAPRLSFLTFCKIFLVSLFGITLSQDLYGLGLLYASATFAAATSNCLPVITFFLAVLLRKEVLKFRTISGVAKLTGILFCSAGAATFAFYKGPYIKLLGHHHLSGHPEIQEHVHLASSKTWIKGCFLSIASTILWGSWLVLQAPLMKSYPPKLLLTTLQCFLSSIQSFAIAIAVGIVVTGVTYYLQACVIEKKGPVFLAMSTPLALIMTIFSSAILLGEIISLGSVLWGKSREQKMDDIGSSSLAAEVHKECSEPKEAVASKSPPVVPLPV